jgi:DNA-binding Xre family transcriptional regulator
VAIRSNLRVLHSLKEANEARKIPYREIHAKTGIAESAISAWMNNKVKYYDANTIDRLCEFYDCEPGDLIIRTNGTEESVAA